MTDSITEKQKRFFYNALVSGLNNPNHPEIFRHDLASALAQGFPINYIAEHIFTKPTILLESLQYPSYIRAGFPHMCLDVGANVNISDRDGNSPILYAAGAEDINLFKRILNSTTDVNASNSLQITPLLRAVQIYLIDFDIKIDRYNENVLKINMLLDAGAKWIHKQDLSKIISGHIKSKADKVRFSKAWDMIDKYQKIRFQNQEEFRRKQNLAEDVFEYEI